MKLLQVKGPWRFSPEISYSAASEMLKIPSIGENCQVFGKFLIAEKENVYPETPWTQPKR